MTTPWQRTAQGANLLSTSGEVGVTIFEEITTLAGQTAAINLGQGFPDQDGPQQIKDQASEAIQYGANQYAPGSGIASLRQAIARHQDRFYGLPIDPEAEVLVTTGATEAIAASILAFAGPADEVLSFEPFYDSYGAMIGLSGARHVTVPLEAPTFQPDLEQLAAAFSERTRIVLLNNPHNPSGAVFGREVLQKIVELAERYDALIVSDEVYEHLTFGVKHLPITTLPGAWNRTITISSAGKTFSLTGWKIGWASAPAPLIAAIRTVKQFLTYSSGSPFQPAIAWGLGQADEFYSGIIAELQHKRDVLAAGLQAAGLTVHLPRGSYFVNADVSPLGVQDAVTLARRLPALIGVAAIPVSVFCHPTGVQRHQSLLRFAFCKRLDVLHEASRRLATLQGRL